MKIGEAFADYLKAADFPEPRTVTMTRCVLEDIGKEKDEKPVLYFHELAERGLVLNKTNFTSIAELCGEDSENWPGQRIELWQTTTSFGSDPAVPCIRVRAVVQPAGMYAENGATVFPPVGSTPARINTVE